MLRIVYIKGDRIEINNISFIRRLMHMEALVSKIRNIKILLTVLILILLFYLFSHT